MSQGRRERTANPELAAAEPRSPAIDARGVDRAQIRELLALAPAQRLAWSQEFWDSVQRIRRLNGTRPLR